MDLHRSSKDLTSNEEARGAQLLHLWLLDLTSDLLIYELYFLMGLVNYFARIDIIACQPSLVSLVTLFRFSNETLGWPLIVCIFLVW